MRWENYFTIYFNVLHFGNFGHHLNARIVEKATDAIGMAMIALVEPSTFAIGAIRKITQSMVSGGMGGHVQRSAGRGEFRALEDASLEAYKRRGMGFP